MELIPLDDETLQRLYAWIDEIPLSRPKKNITRDFSDGILLAEVIGYYFPKLVQMHNYSSANSVKQKQYNWTTLNRKVLKRLHLHLSKDDIDDLVQCRAGAVEHLLVKLQLKIASYKEKRPSLSHSRSGDGSQEHGDEEHTISSPSGAGSVMSFSSNSRSGLPTPGGDKQPELREPQAQTRDFTGDGFYDRGVADVSLSNHLSAASNNSMSHDSREIALQGLQAELAEKDQTIGDLKETIQILEMKVQKLEQLVRLKDGKIQTLVAKLRSQKP